MTRECASHSAFSGDGALDHVGGIAAALDLLDALDPLAAGRAGQSAKANARKSTHSTARQAPSATRKADSEPLRVLKSRAPMVVAVFLCTAEMVA